MSQIMRLWTLILALVGCIVPTGPVFGQGAPAEAPPVVSVHGNADITKPPEVIRLYVKQYGKGTDTDAARSALLAAEKKLTKSLIDAGSDIIVATAGAAMTSSYRNQYQNQLQMIRQRRIANGANPAEINNEKPAVPVILERFITIDLKPKSHKEVLGLVLDIQEKYRKDGQELSGIADLFKDEPNANEGQASFSRTEYNAGYTNDFRIYLAARITKKERQALYSQAFKKARALAAEVAEAAECSLGGLQSVTSQNSLVYSSRDYQGVAMTTVLSSGEVIRTSPFKDDPETETAVIKQFMYGQTGNYDPLIYQVTLNVTYRLSQGK